MELKYWLATNEWYPRVIAITGLTVMFLSSSELIYGLIGLTICASSSGIVLWQVGESFKRDKES